MDRQNTQIPVVTSELFSWMQEIRRTIHKNPELSLQEFATSAYICAKLDELRIDYRLLGSGTGVIAEIGPPGRGQVVGLRADMDALPIEEETGLSFSSKKSGVMHACGHDGHVAMLLGAAALLQSMKLQGRVRLLFQPAEEKGDGALEMMEAGAIDGLSAIFGGHIDTHFATGLITVDEGIICAYADPFTVTMQGVSGHAARPHEGQDAIVAAAGLITSLQSIVAREIDPNCAAVVTVGKVRAGETHNVMAGDAVIEGTVRSTDPDSRRSALSGLKRIVEANANLYGVASELTFPSCLPALINSGHTVDVARHAAQMVVDKKNVISQGPSSLGGEDFAFYLQKIQGCFVRFGARISEETGLAHNSTFDFNEDVYSIGACWYAKVAQVFLEG